jgi:hypothetical protein
MGGHVHVAVDTAAVKVQRVAVPLGNEVVFAADRSGKEGKPVALPLK